MGTLLTRQLQLIVARIVRESKTRDEIEQILQPLPGPDQVAIRDALRALQRWEPNPRARRQTSNDRPPRR